MRVTILGGGGFLGRKLAARLAADGALSGRTVEALTLFDLHAPPSPEGAPFPMRSVAGDVADPAALQRAVPDGTDVVFHLAAVVSAAASAIDAAGRCAKPWRARRSASSGKGVGTSRVCRVAPTTLG